MTPFPPPGLLPFRSSLWIAARLMPMFTKRKGLDALLIMATPHPSLRAYDHLTAREVVDAVKASVARPWRMRGRRCLREGLLAFHYLALVGQRPLLHFGADLRGSHDKKPAAHCWVSVDGRIVLNPPESPIYEFLRYDGTVSAPVGKPALAEIARHV